MEPLVSVIVPIYKVENYLRQCVDSILTQTYTNLEIILVDDGSPDSCGAICDEYAERDARICVIHKPNGGLSDARNAGMDAATGGHLAFVDSDDTLPESAIETLLQVTLERNAQLAIGSSDRMDENNKSLPPVDNNYTKEAVMTREEAMSDFFAHGCSAWARLYRRDVHRGIFFPKGEINEDEAVVLQTLDRCDTVVVTDEIVYHYRCRSNSITTNTFSPEKLAWQRHCRDNLAFVRAKYPELEIAAAKRCRDSLLWSLTEIAVQSNQKVFHDYIEDMMEELKKNEKLFAKIPFDYPQDKLRLFMLTKLGFSIYSKLLKIKRR